MNDSLFMRRGQPTDDLLRIVDHLAQRELTLIQTITQLFTFEQFRDDVRRAFVSTDVKDTENVRMIESAGGLRFLLKAIQPISVIREGSRQNFDRDIATELR